MYVELAIALVAVLLGGASTVTLLPVYSAGDASIK